MKRSVLTLVFFSVLVSGWIISIPTWAMGTKVDTSAVETQQQKGENLAEKMDITETLGPLAPVAL